MKYYFDEAAAKAAVDFFPRFLVHSKGEWAGQPFELDGWQKEIIRELFGWKVDETGARKYRQVLIYVGRKNGKSTLAAGIAILLLVGDGEPGAEIYSAAADREQAKIVFTEASRMVQASPALLDVCQVYKTGIVVLELAGSYKALSADAPTKHGLNPSGVIFDELHTQRSRDLVDTLHTAIGARRQPLEVYITTAGTDRHSICREILDYAINVRDGVIDDPTFLPVIYAAELDDDWRDPEVWKKANPGLGVSISREYLERECKRAEEIPGYQNTFRRLHLNQWVEQDIRWLDIASWDACAGPIPWQDMPAHLIGRECFAGLDLSSKRDLTAWELVFPPIEGDPLWYIVSRFFVPEDNTVERIRRDRVPYDVWAREGAITLTPGNVVDQNRIKAQIFEDADAFNIQEIAFDRWNSTKLVTELGDEGFTVVDFGQGYGSMSSPSKDFGEELIPGRKIAHGGHPVLRWNAVNVAIQTDASENIKPAKDKSGDRIDGIVAVIMAVGRAMAVGQEEESVYLEGTLAVIG